ncbi:hypothetical protein BGZ75_003258 [Mortierella antarctica]|nr:hypothetical protein BGZ75_003258 [Mortierella antarctica]
MTATEEIHAAIEKNKSSLQDIELMINSVGSCPRGSVPGTRKVYIYCSRESIEAGYQFGRNPQSSVGAESTLESTKRREYLNLSVDDTLRWFKRSARQSGLRVFAVRLGDQPSLPFSIVKVCIAGVLNAFIVMETSKKGRCLAISRLVVFGAGEENSIWEDSNHLVFRKITQTAVGAVDYYKAKEPRSLLGLVLEWIATYCTLFTAPCAGCHKHLLFDSQHFKHLPPTLYTYDKPKPAPFHPQCLA